MRTGHRLLNCACPPVELEAERQRVQELKVLHSELEAALLEEQRLRKHEEEVMRMQAALVEEQVLAREKLEAMRVEQEALLGAEIQKRAEIQVKLADQNEKITLTEKQLNKFESQLKVRCNFFIPCRVLLYICTTCKGNYK